MITFKLYEAVHLGAMPPELGRDTGYRYRGEYNFGSCEEAVDFCRKIDVSRDSLGFVGVRQGALDRVSPGSENDAFFKPLSLLQQLAGVPDVEVLPYGFRVRRPHS